MPEPSKHVPVPFVTSQSLRSNPCNWKSTAYFVTSWPIGPFLRRFKVLVKLPVENLERQRCYNRGRGKEQHRTVIVVKNLWHASLLRYASAIHNASSKLDCSSPFREEATICNLKRHLIPFHHRSRHLHKADSNSLPHLSLGKGIGYELPVKVPSGRPGRKNPKSTAWGATSRKVASLKCSGSEDLSMIGLFDDRVHERQNDDVKPLWRGLIEAALKLQRWSSYFPRKCFSKKLEAFSRQKLVNSLLEAHGLIELTFATEENSKTHTAYQTNSSPWRPHSCPRRYSRNSPPGHNQVQNPCLAPESKRVWRESTEPTRTYKSMTRDLPVTAWPPM